MSGEDTQHLTDFEQGPDGSIELSQFGIPTDGLVRDEPERSHSAPRTTPMSDDLSTRGIERQRRRMTSDMGSHRHIRERIEALRPWPEGEPLIRALLAYEKTVTRSASPTPNLDAMREAERAARAAAPPVLLATSAAERCPECAARAAAPPVEPLPDIDAEDSEHTDDWLDGYEAGWKDSRAAEYARISGGGS